MVHYKLDVTSETRARKVVGHAKYHKIMSTVSAWTSELQSLSDELTSRIWIPEGALADANAWRSSLHIHMPCQIEWLAAAHVDGMWQCHAGFE